jgi:DNA-binding NtrC family response regulator
LNTSPCALVVDDELDLAWALQQNLTLDGWQVVVAHDGNAAIAQAAVAPVQVAFVDAKLPDMDGLDVAKSILELCPTAMVILISGYYYPEDQTVKEALRRGLFVHFVSKPFDLNEISALAQRALSPLSP